MSDEVTSALIAAAVASFTILIQNLTALQKERRARRSQMYGEAFRAVLAWREMYYRVLRRGETGESAQDLRARFHDLQESIDFHRGWIEIESEYLANSYCNFVQEVKSSVSGLIKEAWSQDPQPILDQDKTPHPDIEKPCKDFLKKVRSEVNPWWKL
jgi:hypothetical protein